MSHAGRRARRRAKKITAAQITRVVVAATNTTAALRSGMVGNDTNDMPNEQIDPAASPQVAPHASPSAVALQFPVVTAILRALCVRVKRSQPILMRIVAQAMRALGSGVATQPRTAGCVLGPGAVLGGRYRLREPIGEGGMATVYRAVDTRLGVDRAVKVVQPELSAKRGILDRFEREARILAELEHPHIVPVHDAGMHDESLYLVMSLSVRGSVQDHLDRHGPYAPIEAIDIASGVLSALAVAHDRGVIHRDVKPPNVLFDPTASPCWPTSASPRTSASRSPAPDRGSAPSATCPPNSAAAPTASTPAPICTPWAR